MQRPLASKQLGKRLRDFGARGGDDASRMGGQRVWTGIAVKGEPSSEALMLLQAPMSAVATKASKSSE